MGEKFEIGGQCVCIIGGTWMWHDQPSDVSPTLGRIYTIHDIVSLPYYGEYVGLKLLEFMGPHIFSSRGFRPCKKTDISSLESLLKKKPSKKLLTVFDDRGMHEYEM